MWMRRPPKQYLGQSWTDGMGNPHRLIGHVHPNMWVRSEAAGTGQVSSPSALAKCNVIIAVDGSSVVKNKSRDLHSVLAMTGRRLHEG